MYGRHRPLARNPQAKKKEGPEISVQRKGAALLIFGLQNCSLASASLSDQYYILGSLDLMAASHAAMCRRSGERSDDDQESAGSEDAREGGRMVCGCDTSPALHG